MKINGTEVAPGEHKIVKLAVGRLPSGNTIRIQAHVYRSEKPGPCVLVLAGVHGDEINGVEIVRRAITQDYFKPLSMGTVIAIPILNIYGFINFSRDVPDGKDVNRSFPGNTQGSLASRVARTLTKKVLPLCDYVLDFHTGGRSLYNYPQVRYTNSHDSSVELARLFSAPLLVAKPTIQKSLRKVATDQGKPTLVFEGGESLRYDGFAIQKGLEGLKRVLVGLGLSSKEVDYRPPIAIIEKTIWVRAPRAGMFLWHKCSGNEVHKGEVLGHINDPYGDGSIKVVAKRDGLIIGHNNAAVVSQGDALFQLGYGY
jgi:predicted deacylase